MTTKLDFYLIVIEYVTGLMNQFNVTITTTLEAGQLSVTLVNHQIPTLSKKITCKDLSDDEQQSTFLVQLGDMQCELFQAREENIRYGLKLALQHMKESTLLALDHMDPNEIFRYVQEEIQNRKKK
jgi:hypothetical protein